MSVPPKTPGPPGYAVLSVLLVAVLAATAGPGPDDPQETTWATSLTTLAQEGDAMSMQKLTPVLYVEEIEPCLPFWTERLDFEVTGTVPEGDRTGFAMLEKDGVEIMYQTRSSVENDIPRLADRPVGSAFLFIQVGDIDAVETALSDVEKVVPRRTTEYGATEVVVLEPGGNAVIFAEFGRED